ncbi:MAG: NfeD family protein [Candidatus Acidoferrales bacterium]
MKKRFRGLFSARGSVWLILWVGVCLFGWQDLASLAPAEAEATPAKAYWIVVRGEVNSRAAERVRHGLARASAREAEVVILEIDTFGGELDAAVRIRDALLDSPQRTIAFVNRHAISAGALLALATHDIVMAPGSTIGAATPLRLTWTGTEPAGEKAISYFRKEMKATAESRGHPGPLAEAMVDPDVVVPGVVEKGKLLTLTTQEALQLELAAAQTENLEQLLQAYHLELIPESQELAARAAQETNGPGWFGGFRAWQLWFILGLLLVVAEILLPGFVILWFAVGAFLASLLALLGLPRSVQVGAFLASAFLLLVFSRTIFHSILFRSRESIATNIEALKGRQGIVLKLIEGSVKPGSVKIGGETWSAVCDDQTRIAKETKVEVLEVVGNKVKVKPV